jgi:prepilin-type N-terminal cleavage/methylation domain-containing protein
MPSTLPVRQRCQAFTIVEMLVVIMILAILISLGVGAGISFRRDARLKQVKAVLDTCRAAATEYQTVTGMTINHSAFDPANAGSTDVGPFNWWQFAQDKPVLKPLDEKQEEDDQPDSKPSYVYIERFVWAASQVPSVKKILEGRAFLADTDGDGFQELVDPFGQPLAYAAFVSHRRPDGTGGDEIKFDDYLPESRQPYFGSAGMDGKWGKARTKEEFGSDQPYQEYLVTEEGKFAQDNLYSLTTD